MFFLKQVNKLAPLEKFIRKIKQKNNTLTGFTLIELVVVVAIIGILMTVSSVRFGNTFSNLRFEDFYKKLVIRMNFLKQRAIVLKQIYRLDFDSSNFLFSIKSKKYDQEDFIQPKGFFFRDIPVPKDIEVVAESPSLFFFPDGTIQGKNLQINSKDNRAIIVIQESIGRISVLKDVQ